MEDWILVRSEPKLKPFKCPECGWETKVRESTATKICKSCRKVWSKRTQITNITYNPDAMRRER